MSITAGVSQHREGDGLDSVIRRADEAMYCGKKAGKDCVVVSGN